VDPQPPGRAMKRFLLPFLLACAVACGGGDSSPTGSDSSSNTPPKDVPVVTSGTFVVTATMSFDGCNQATVWDGEYNIGIAGTDFVMSPFNGSWDPLKAKALGETRHNQSTSRTCTVTTWTAVDITFTTEDTFYGNIIYRYRVAGDCGDRNPCATSWLISGTRKKAQVTP